MDLVDSFLTLWSKLGPLSRLDGLNIETKEEEMGARIKTCMCFEMVDFGSPLA